MLHRFIRVASQSGDARCTNASKASYLVEAPGLGPRCSVQNGSIARHAKIAEDSTLACGAGLQCHCRYVVRFARRAQPTRSRCPDSHELRLTGLRGKSRSTSWPARGVCVRSCFPAGHGGFCPQPSGRKYSCNSSLRGHRLPGPAPHRVRDPGRAPGETAPWGRRPRGM